MTTAKRKRGGARAGAGRPKTHPLKQPKPARVKKETKPPFIKKTDDDRKATLQRCRAEWAKNNRDHLMSYASGRRQLPAEKAAQKDRDARQRDVLSDSYVAHAMQMTVRNAPKELIQAKRERIQITRLLRELNKELKETK